MVFTGLFGLFSSNNECIKNHTTFQGKGKELSFTSMIGNQHITAKIVIQEMTIYFYLAYKDNFFFPGILQYSKLGNQTCFSSRLPRLAQEPTTVVWEEIIDPPSLPPTKILDSFLIVIVLIADRFQAEHQLVLS